MVCLKMTLPGVKEALQGLRARDKTIAFVTNNSTQTRSKLLLKFKKLGMTPLTEQQQLQNVSLSPG